jgi:hypothetical protein
MATFIGRPIALQRVQEFLSAVFVGNSQLGLPNIWEVRSLSEAA